MNRDNPEGCAAYVLTVWTQSRAKNRRNQTLLLLEGIRSKKAHGELEGYAGSMLKPIWQESDCWTRSGPSLESVQ